MRRSLEALWLVACMAVPSTAQGADVLYDAFIPSGGELGFNDPLRHPQRIAEFIELGADAIATGVKFVGGYYPANTPQDDSFTLTLYRDRDGLPDPSSVLFRTDLQNVERMKAGTSAFIDLYHYSTDFSPVSLPANTPFWIMILNSVGGDNGWVWAGTKFGGHGAQSLDAGATWRPSSYRYSFALTGTFVPEPGISALLVLPVLCLRRRHSG